MVVNFDNVLFLHNLLEYIYIYMYCICVCVCVCVCCCLNDLFPCGLLKIFNQTWLLVKV